MAEYFGTTVDDIFNTMESRFRVEGAAGMDAVLAYDVTGDGGGKWTVTVRDNKVKVEKAGEIKGFSVKSTVDAETFVGISLGKVDGMQAFTGGKLKVEGDMSLLAASPKLFTKYTPPKKGVTAQDIFATLVARFQPEKAQGLDVKIGYDIPGDGGGQWTAIIKDGKCALDEGLRDDLTVVNIVNAKDYVDLMLGKLDPMMAIGAGRLRLKGDMETAKLLPAIFAKYEPPKSEEEQELIAIKRNISVNMKYSTGPVMGRFFEGLIEKKIFANVCPKCKRKQLPPREVCAECRVRATEWAEVGPDGEITRLEHVYYASPDPLTGETRETPYGTVYVLLDGCKSVETLWHTLRRTDLADAKVGSRVRPAWAEKRTGSIRDIECFELIR